MKSFGIIKKVDIVKKKYVYKNYMMTLKNYICLRVKVFQNTLLEYWRYTIKEDKGNICDKENSMLVVKEIPLYYSCDRVVAKHEYSYNSSSHRKTISI